MQKLLVLSCLLVLFLSSGCKQDDPKELTTSVTLTKEEQTVAGISWSHPSRWTKAEQRPMRVVTYQIPPAKGDTDPGELAVFYFGSNEGGDIEPNIDRWMKQFEKAEMTERSTAGSDSLAITRLRIKGDYLAPSGPMMQSQGKKENYELLGAIVNTKQGAVFFKGVGPMETMEAARNEFNALLESIKLQ